MFYILRKVIRKLPDVVIKAVPLPTPETVSGFETRNSVGTLCKKYGFSSVLVVTDKTIYSLGLHEKLVNSLKENGISYSVFSDISSEPNFTIIDNGRKALFNCKAECVIALGGGAVMDSCKLISAGGRNQNKKTKAFIRKLLILRKKTLPIIAVPTTSGTGAEITVASVVTNKKGRKTPTVIVGLDVKAVILDGELTQNAPKNITCACGIDALSHGLEGVVASVKSSKEDLEKSMLCVKLVLDNLPKLIDNPKDIDARQNMCLAANLGGNAINKQLAGYVHAFAHSIGAKYHIPHGNAIALSILPVMDFQKKKCNEKLSRLAKYLGLFMDGDTDDTASKKVLDKIKNLIDLCGFPSSTNLIKKEDYKYIARAVSLDSVNYSAPVVLTNKQIYSILDKIGK